MPQISKLSVFKYTHFFSEESLSLTTLNTCLFIGFFLGVLYVKENVLDISEMSFDINSDNNSVLSFVPSVSNAQAHFIYNFSDVICFNNLNGGSQ